MEPVYFILPVQIMLLKHIRNTDFGGELFSQSGQYDAPEPVHRSTNDGNNVSAEVKELVEKYIER